MFFYRIHKHEGEMVLAACDERIRGKLLRKSPRFEVGSFYGTEKIGREVVELARKATSLNLIGNRIVSLMEEEGIVDRKSSIIIGGEKHAIVISVP